MKKLTRLITITEKIPREVTGLKSGMYVHMDFTADQKLEAVRFSTKGKEKDSTLDNILTALGDVVTEIIEENSGN